MGTWIAFPLNNEPTHPENSFGDAKMWPLSEDWALNTIPTSTYIHVHIHVHVYPLK